MDNHVKNVILLAIAIYDNILSYELKVGPNGNSNNTFRRYAILKYYLIKRKIGRC